LSIEPDDHPNWLEDNLNAVHPEMEPHWHLHVIRRRINLQCIIQTRINTKRFIEAELVAIDDTMGQSIFTRNFLSAHRQ